MQGQGKKHRVQQRSAGILASWSATSFCYCPCMDARCLPEPLCDSPSQLGRAEKIYWKGSWVKMRAGRGTITGKANSNQGNQFYYKSNQSRIRRNKTKSEEHLPPPLPYSQAELHPDFLSLHPQSGVGGWGAGTAVSLSHIVTSSSSGEDSSHSSPASVWGSSSTSTNFAMVADELLCRVCFWRGKALDNFFFH